MRKVSVVILVVILILSTFLFSSCNSDKVNIDGVVYLLLEEHATVIEYKGKSLEVVIMEEVEGLDVDMIKKNVFENKNIVKITIPDTIQFIDDYAFKNCKDLLVLEYNKGLISGNAFEGCSSLTTITFKENVKIYGAAFKDCTSLETINFSSGILIRNVFEGCTALTKVYIPKTITRMTQDVFKGCSVELYFETETALDTYPKSFDGVKSIHWGVTKAEFDSL